MLRQALFDLRGLQQVFACTINCYRVEIACRQRASEGRVRQRLHDLRGCFRPLRVRKRVVDGSGIARDIPRYEVRGGGHEPESCPQAGSFPASPMA